MWARVMDGELLEIINTPKSLTINDIQYPVSIFTTAWTDEERKAIGIVPYVYFGNSINNMFYRTSEADVIVEEDRVVVVRETTARDIDSIKSVMKTHINSVLSNFLTQTDWYQIRNVENSTAIPANVIKWRADLRKKSAALEATIDAATDVESLEAMTAYTQEMLDAGKKASEFDEWPSDPREEVK